jgi:hypothetical protein
MKPILCKAGQQLREMNDDALKWDTKTATALGNQPGRLMTPSTK